MSHAAAAVVDLQEFRARRGVRPEPRPATPSPAPRALAPFWVVWIPMWPVR